MLRALGRTAEPPRRFADSAFKNSAVVDCSHSRAHGRQLFKRLRPPGQCTGSMPRKPRS